jgi:hypothetical protein
VISSSFCCGTCIVCVHYFGSLSFVSRMLFRNLSILFFFKKFFLHLPVYWLPTSFFPIFFRLRKAEIKNVTQFFVRCFFQSKLLLERVRSFIEIHGVDCETRIVPKHFSFLKKNFSSDSSLRASFHLQLQTFPFLPVIFQLRP